MDLAFKQNAQILNRVEVGTLVGNYKSLALSCFIQKMFWCVFGITVLLEHKCLQISTVFEMKLKNVEVVLQIFQCISSTGSKTA